MMFLADGFFKMNDLFADVHGMELTLNEIVSIR
jgi:hypothetical protein